MKSNNTKEIKASAESSALFAATLLNAATSVHYLHLKSTSYAQHVALGDLYDALPGAVDGLVEVWQGRYQTLLEYPTQGVTSPSDPLDFVLKLHGYVINNRYSFAPIEDTEIQNMIDDLIATLGKTAYKLKFLK